VALPVPYAFAVIVIQEALLVAVHAQLASAVTTMLPFAATEVERVDDVGEIAGVQAELNAKVLDRALETVATEPTAFTTASYTTPAGSGVVNIAAKFTRIKPSASGAGLPRSAFRTSVPLPAR
jgi:hypothetical protein